MAFIGPLPALLLTLGLMVALPLAGPRWPQRASACSSHRRQGMLVLGVSHALWSWRKLDAATRYLVDELQSPARQRRAWRPQSRSVAASGDFLGRRIHALRQAAEQLSDLHRFVSDSLEGLPDATLVCDKGGVVLLANAAAARHFGADSGEKLQGREGLDPDERCAVAGRSQTGRDRPRSLRGRPRRLSAAAHDGLERELLVRQAPTFSGSGEHLGMDSLARRPDRYSPGAAPARPRHALSQP